MTTSGAHTDFANAMSYGDYLHLDDLLHTQEPRSGAHDEMLFIVIHQSSELWMKLILHELQAAVTEIQRDNLRPAFKMLARVSGIQGQLIQSWDVLSTMTPADYLTFRDALGQSSGFQSHQYRTIEFMLGNKNPDLLRPFAHRPDIHGPLQAVLSAPSVYDEALALLAQRGLPVPGDRIARDWRQPYVASDGVRT
ncbi:MAG: tryptophan 2,3-dioxygenase, partial [Rhodospirillaceae bacterium]|nr:tryptophan 2,3-dioxygenase [Rhodospirillaceae bacterium]